MTLRRIQTGLRGPSTTSALMQLSRQRGRRGQPAEVSSESEPQTLADVLAEGNDADEQQIKNLADGTDPQDAATVAQIGSQPAQAYYQNEPVIHPGGFFDSALTFDNLIIGTELLDRGVPGAPQFLEAGAYVVSGCVGGPSPSEEEAGNVTVDIGPELNFPVPYDAQGRASFCFPAVVEAGDELRVFVSGPSGSFNLVDCNIVKFS